MAIEPKLRPYLRYLVRKLPGQGNGAKPAEEEGISLPACFQLSHSSTPPSGFEPNHSIFLLFLEVGWVVHIELMEGGKVRGCLHRVVEWWLISRRGDGREG